MKNKLPIDWKKVLLFVFVSAGLILITGSVLMSAGIVLVLFIIDGLLANWEYRRQTKKIFDELREMQREKEQKQKHQDEAKS